MTPAPQAQMPPQAQQLLEQMHGIITPTPIGWWPPAPGWWVLLVLIIGAAAALIIALRRRRRRNAYKGVALKMLQDLQSCNDEQLVGETNRLLKRVALVAYPGERTTINQLFGEAWVSWLNQCCRREVFSGQTADALASGGYRPTQPCPREDLFAGVKRWLVGHKRGKNGSKARV